MREHKTSSEWQALIDEQIVSGLSKTKFCQQKGIAISRFYYHLNLLKPAAENDQAKVLSSKPSSTLIPIQIKDSARKAIANECSIRLLLKNGLECVLPSSIGNKRMKEIIEVLISC